MAGLIRKNLRKAGLRVNSVNDKTSEKKGELGGAQTHGGPVGALCFLPDDSVSGMTIARLTEPRASVTKR